MNKITITQNNMQIEMYSLYLNTVDNTTVIVTDKLASLFERTLTNYGSAPKLIAQSYMLSDLQIKAIEFGIPPDLIDNLDWN
jgi:hypothetical protein